MKAKYNQIMSLPTTNVFQKIFQGSYETKVSYRLKRFGDKVHAVRKKISSEYEKLVHEFAKKDAEGKVILPENNPTSFEVDDNRGPEYQAAETAFGEREHDFEIDMEKFPGDWLEKNGQTFSVSEIAALEPFFDFRDQTEIASEQAESLRAQIPVGDGEIDNVSPIGGASA